MYETVWKDCIPTAYSKMAWEYCFFQVHFVRAFGDASVSWTQGNKSHAFFVSPNYQQQSKKALNSEIYRQRQTIRHMKKLFTLVASLCLSGHWAMAEVHTGTCGENLTWSLDTESGALVIEGSGEMENYVSPWYGGSGAPWSAFDSPVKSVSLPKGLTTIGNGAFSNNSQFVSIEIPEGVIAIGDGAFWGNTSLTTIVWPNTLEYIMFNAFNSCSALSEVIFPKGLKYVRQWAFANCVGLKKVSFLEGLEGIDMGVFENCTNLENVILPEGLKYIGGSAFSGCVKLNEITIPNSVESIAGESFLNTGITGPIRNEYTLFSVPKDISGEYIIPSGIQTIASGAFGDCTGLTAVTMPEGVKNIGEYAFGGCTSLATVNLPASVDSIQHSTFSGCSSLTTVTFSEGLKYIGESAFGDCTSLTTVSLPASLNNLQARAFSSCSSLATISFAEGLKSIGEYAFSSCTALTSVSLPETLTSIGDYAFYGCTELKEIKIPNSITEVGNSIFPDLGFPILNDYIFFRLPKDYSEYEYQIPDGIHTIAGGAFESCRMISSVIIPQTVTTIGNSAFNGCESLYHIKLPDGLKSIGEFAFAGTDLYGNHIMIPDNVTRIGEYAFKNSHISEVTLPKHLKTIEKGTFYMCNQLKSIVLPAELTNIGREAFSVCHQLTAIDLPKTLNVIGESAFNDCEHLATIIIPENVTSIGKGAFSSIDSLVSIEVLQGNTHYCTDNNVLYTFNKDTLMLYPAKKSGYSFDVPTTVKVIDEYVFAWNKYLATISLPDGLKSIGKGAFRNSKLTSVTIPEGITELNAQTFCECHELASVTLPSTLKSINGDANFMECAFKSIVLPASLEYIGPLTFTSNKLESVISYAPKAPKLGYDAFMDISSDATLYYPDGSDYSSWLPYFANTASDIKEMTVGNGRPTLPTNIYDLNGRIVKQNATTLEGLPRGLYIMGGKKVMKR